jgi:hypothetical protein
MNDTETFAEKQLAHMSSNLPRGMSALALKFLYSSSLLLANSISNMKMIEHFIHTAIYLLDFCGLKMLSL